MPGEFALPSLEIHNFRGLRELKISRLGRANLIVGKNNVGKTTVLEALRIYARPGSIDDLLQLLVSRDEIPTPRKDTRDQIICPLPTKLRCFSLPQGRTQERKPNSYWADRQA